jgi:hypothetical protein
MTDKRIFKEAYRFLFLEPDPLLILDQERVPGLFHVQVAATHLDRLVI